MTVRVGLIGCGGIVHGHVKRFRETGQAEVVALQDPSDAAIDALIEKQGLGSAIRRYANHREMLKAGGLDAVLIASPHTLHDQHTMDALDAGLHVLLEKPMSCSVAEAEVLVQRMQSSDRVVMLSYQRHYEPVFRYARHLVHSGELGRLSYMQAFLSQEWMQGTMNTWRQTPELGGGGFLLDSGSHICDMLLFIPGQRIRSVAALVDFRGRPVDINVGALLQYEDGLMGTLTLNGDAAGWREDWTITGEKGTLYIRGGQLLLKRLGERAVEIDPATLPAAPGPNQAFIDAILRGGSNETPVEIGLEVIRLTEAIWRSGLAQGAPISV